MSSNGEKRAEVKSLGAGVKVLIEIKNQSLERSNCCSILLQFGK